MFLGNELGSDVVNEFVGAAAISAVNLGEVTAKLVERGASALQVQSMLRGPGLEVIEFDEHQAIQSGLLRAATSRFGLSFGERACVALAQHLKLPVLTADRAWKDLDVSVEVILIR